mmetsp:Transcript_27961/g.76929  ORF Transcript_27961/g.76929 Transcript_27961/m.76929 type:complete len:1286 (-) Transcript_27961:132-3989(-)
MALAQKLEQDNLRLVCQRSVEELHQLFVAWFQGTEAKDGLTTALLECLAPEFSHVAPNGQFLQGRSILISHLQDKYACYNNRLFQIEIYDVKLLWSDATGDRCLCTYEEWQSWLPDNAVELNNHDHPHGDMMGSPPSVHDAADDEEEGMHQFGRLSTCLLERKANVPTDGSAGAYRWVHVHETWLEAESPQHERDQHSNGGGEAGSYLEEETILTGPVEYHKMIADRSPANMLEGGDDDSDDDGDDMVGHARSSSADEDDEDDDEEDSVGPPSPNGILGATPKKDEEAGAGTFAAATGTFSAIARAHSHDTSTDTGGEPDESDDDDDDETDNAVDRHLLMLMSNQSISRDQMKRQDEARNILENSGIAFYELDGANPEERENRNSLFQLSGKWGQYPQFFMVDTAGSTTFWGDFEKFESSHKAGRLQSEIESQLDDTTEADDDATDNDESSMPPLPPGSILPAAPKSDRSSSPAPSVEDSSASSSDDDELRQSNQQPLAKQVAPLSAGASQSTKNENMPLVAANCKLVLLMSAQTLSRDQKHRQEEMESLLKEKDISFEAVDGSAKDAREKRNQLFRVSTFWGKYPQLFHEDKHDGTVTYWGAWDEFEASVERKTLEHDLSYVSPPPPPTEEQIRHRKASLSHGLAAIEKKSENKVLAEKSPDKGSAESIGSASNLKTLPTAASALEMSAKQDPKGASTSSLEFEKPIILLLSKQSLSREQMNRQTQARKYLKGMDFVELDGASREHRHARNELFKISKLWGRYPQLHLKAPDQSEPIFFGDWEKLDSVHSNGTLKQEIMAIVAPNESFSSAVTSSSEQSSIMTANQPIPPLLDSKISPGDRVNGAPSWATGSVLATGATAASKASRANSQASEEKSMPATSEDQFLEKADGILQFEEDKGEKEAIDEKKSDERMDEERLKEVQSTASPIPQDASSKRHVSSKLLKYAKPLTWENSLVGLSINGFDIGTSQGPTADANWYKEVSDALEMVAQYSGGSGAPQPRRRLALPDKVYPTAHVALEGHGFWLSWDVLDAMEEWARAHAEIEVHSTQDNRGVSVMRSMDGEKFWERKNTSRARTSGPQPSSFHFDWTYSTPFPGKVEGGEWVELDESGMRVDLLTDMSMPILFFDEIVLFEDDLQEHGQVQFSVKLRVMPSCAYVLARLFIRVDQVTIRVRETRLLVDFLGISPSVYRDVTWRECPWELLTHNKLPTVAQEWHFDGKETPAWQNLLRKIPEVDPPKGVAKFAKLEPSKALLVKQLNNDVEKALQISGGMGDNSTSLDYLEV